MLTPLPPLALKPRCRLNMPSTKALLQSPNRPGALTAPYHSRPQQDPKFPRTHSPFASLWPALYLSRAASVDGGITGVGAAVCELLKAPQSRLLRDSHSIRPFRNAPSSSSRWQTARYLSARVAVATSKHLESVLPPHPSTLRLSQQRLRTHHRPLTKTWPVYARKLIALMECAMAR